MKAVSSEWSSYSGAGRSNDDALLRNNVLIDGVCVSSSSVSTTFYGWSAGSIWRKLRIVKSIVAWSNYPQSISRAYIYWGHVPLDTNNRREVGCISDYDRALGYLKNWIYFICGRKGLNGDESTYFRSKLGCRPWSESRRWGSWVCLYVEPVSLGKVPEMPPTLEMPKRAQALPDNFRHRLKILGIA